MPSRIWAGRISVAAIDAVEPGEIEVDVTEVFPLEEAARAHDLLEQRRSAGKLILRARAPR
jgi:NADPH:quinone reductase-like Zn-dependent oxidoreductase